MEKPTLQEWLINNKPKCKKCKEVFQNLYTEALLLKDIDYERQGFFCRSCYQIALDELMESRVVEEYKGNKIYCKDGRYSPYWQSPYYFKTLEECRIRIDHSHVAFFPADGFEF